jgi:hypothetical protein
MVFRKVGWDNTGKNRRDVIETRSKQAAAAG